MLNRLGIGALIVAALNVFLGEAFVEGLGGTEQVSGIINNFVNLLIVAFASFNHTKKSA